MSVLQVSPAGKVGVRETNPVNPFRPVTVIDDNPNRPTGTGLGVLAERVKSTGVPAPVKVSVAAAL